MLKDTIHSKLLLHESAILQGRKDGRQKSIEDTYGEIMMYLDNQWWWKIYRGLFRKRWNLNA